MEYVKYQRCDILLAAAFCGTVFGLESANVVGYNKAATQAGDNIYRVATFEGVAGNATSFKVGDISVGTEDFAWYNNCIRLFLKYYFISPYFILYIGYCVYIIFTINHTFKLL